MLNQKSKGPGKGVPDLVKSIHYWCMDSLKIQLFMVILISQGL